MAHSKGPLSRAVKVERSANQEKRSDHIAAIDFGTSSLSLAYTTPFHDKVKTLQLHKTYERVPNAILLEVDKDNQCTVKDIGHEAQTAYSKLRAKNTKEHIYFERVKNVLKRDKVRLPLPLPKMLYISSSQSLDRNTIVSSFTGGSYYLVEVIAFIIKHLKELLLKHLYDGRRHYKSTDFDWVITVPAIWKARAKRMMRQ